MEGWDDLQWLLWIGLALLLGAIEVSSLDFVFGMVAAAALVAALAAALGLGFPLQVITFALAAGLLLVVARPLVLRYVRPRLPSISTGTEANLGQLAEVLQQVTPRDGRVKLRGEVWSARTDSGGPLPVGEDVEVVRIDGATAVVRALPPADPPDRPGPAPGPGGPGSGPGQSPSSPWSAS